MKSAFPIIAFGLATVSVIGLAAEQSSTPPASSRLGRGYLQPGEAPDSSKLLPPPPSALANDMIADKKGEARALSLHGTPRWDQAKIDADLFSEKSTNVMSCAAGRVIGKEQTPKTFALLRKAGADFGMSSYPAKSIYKRKRPFLENGKPICTPEMRDMLANDGSYPSGHAAIGYGWGMIMAEILPKRRAALLKRAAAFADSRRICNVHYLSDIAAGKTLAEAVKKSLQNNDGFKADLAEAKVEMRSQPVVKPVCTFEKRALRLR